MPAIYRRIAWALFAGTVAATDADVLGNVNALNTCFTATIYILLLREDSSMEYIPGIVCSNGTDWRRCACDMPSSFLISAASRTRNRGEKVRQRMQHLSSNGRKTNPLKASHWRQSRVQSTLKMSFKVYHAAIFVRRIMHMALRACVIRGWYPGTAEATWRARRLTGIRTETADPSRARFQRGSQREESAFGQGF